MSQGKLGRVLVVDDEPEMVGTLCRLLERHGYEAIGREEGSAALVLLGQEDFDLLLTDLMMPGMDGLTLMELAQQLDPQVVCIVMTGQATVQTAVDAMKLGAFDYITKPFKLHELLPVFARALEMRRIRMENVQLRQTVAMQELTSALTLTLERETILEKVADAALQQCDADEASILLYSPGDHVFQVAVIGGDWTGPGVGEQLPIAPEVAPWLEQHQARVTDADGTEPLFPPIRTGPGLSAVSVPMLLGGRLIGVLHVARKKSARPFAPGQVKGLTILAGTASAALESARLVQQLRESNRRLELALEELQKAQQQILEQERLSALGQMASGIAHDFNNALAPILGFADLLVRLPENRNNPETLTSYLEYIRIGAGDAAAVVRRLREFYRGREEEDAFQPIDLREVVEQTVSLTQPRWKDQTQAQGRTVRIDTRLASVAPVMGDESQLRELLTNLIFNAVDAMPNGGSICIATGTDGTHAILEVSDEGTGMPEEVRQHCLDPFFTTKGEKGTGLGLSMVYGITKRHHGSLEIESEVGKGTTFRMRLPFGRTAVADNAPQHSPIPMRLHVLVVDDEAMVRNLVATYFAADGHTTETAASAREALERFRPGAFDLVVTDRAMPDGSGDQLAVAIRQIAADQPIILLTGFGELMIARSELPEGVDVILGKPVTLGELREAVSKALTTPAAPPSSAPDHASPRASRSSTEALLPGGVVACN